MVLLGAQLLTADACTASGGCYDAAAVNATFQLSGDCGPAGTITVSGEAGTCNLRISGDLAGLSTVGIRNRNLTPDLGTGGWLLFLTGAEGVTAECDVVPDPAGGLQATCKGDAFSCSMHLTPR